MCNTITNIPASCSTDHLLLTSVLPRNLASTGSDTDYCTAQTTYSMQRSTQLNHQTPHVCNINLGGGSTSGPWQFDCAVVWFPAGREPNCLGTTLCTCLLCYQGLATALLYIYCVWINSVGTTQMMGNKVTRYNITFINSNKVLHATASTDFKL